MISLVTAVFRQQVALFLFCIFLSTGQSLCLKGEGSFCTRQCSSEAGFLLLEESSLSTCCCSCRAALLGSFLLCLLCLALLKALQISPPKFNFLHLLSFPKLLGVYIWGPSVILAQRDNSTWACFFSLPSRGCELSGFIFKLSSNI